MTIVFDKKAVPLRSPIRAGRIGILCRDVANIFWYGVGAPRYAQRILVDPTQIDRVGLPFSRKWSGSVVEGDWDKDTMPLDSFAKFQICVERFVKGKTWEEAGAYRLTLEEMRKRPGADGCFTLNDVLERYKNIDELYATIKAERKLQSGRGKGDRNFREIGGVLVHIDRRARVIFGGGGCHRFAIARILQIPVIPAQLGVVHKHAIAVWKKRRNKVW